MRTDASFFVDPHVKYSMSRPVGSTTQLPPYAATKLILEFSGDCGGSGIANLPLYSSSDDGGVLMVGQDRINTHQFLKLTQSSVEKIDSKDEIEKWSNCEPPKLQTKIIGQSYSMVIFLAKPFGSFI